MIVTILLCLLSAFIGMYIGVQPKIFYLHQSITSGLLGRFK